jgi:hypothetical protein
VLLNKLLTQGSGDSTPFNLSFMELYSIQVYFSLRNKAYTERDGLNCCHRLYKTWEEAVEAVKNEVEATYAHSNFYHSFKGEYPHETKYGRSNGYFECSYSFGPYVHYDIFIVKHNY